MYLCAIQSGSHRRFSLKTVILLPHVDGFWILSPPLKNYYNQQTLVLNSNFLPLNFHMKRTFYLLEGNVPF